MGLLPCSCPLPCNQNRSECETKSTHLQSEPSTSSSLLSQPSLPLVPSLSSPPQQSSSVDHQCLVTLKVHSSYVSSLALSTKSLYIGSSNSEIRVWPREPPFSPEYSTGSGDDGRNVVAIGNGGVKSLVVLRDKLISAHQDHKIRVWKIVDESNRRDEKYKCVATLPTMSDRFMSLFTRKSYVEVRRHKKCTWVHHVDVVSSLALSQDDDSLLYSASWDRSFKIWRTSDFKCLESIEKAHDDAINAIVVSREGFVYTGSADKKIKVWSKKDKTHSLVATLTKHLSAVNALAVSEDGKVLYSGACDRSILVWERLSGDDEELHMSVAGALRGHTKAILCLAVVSNLVFSGSADKSLRVWRRGLMEKEGYSCLAVLEGHTKPVKCLAVSVLLGSDSDSGLDSVCSCMVYSGSLDLSVKVWNLRVSSL